MDKDISCASTSCTNLMDEDIKRLMNKVEINRDIIELFKYELKFIRDPAKRNEEAIAKMKELAIAIKDNLDRMPELKGAIENSLYRSYVVALKMEVLESKLPIDNYPAYLNWTLEDILNLATECEGMDKASGECDNMVSFKEFLSSLKDDE